MRQAANGADPRIPVAPPLWVWLAAALLSLLIIGLCFVHRPQITRHHFNPQRLAKFKRSGDTTGPPRVAVIGTSLTQCAFYQDACMEAVAASLGYPIVFLRFTLNGGLLPQFLEILDEVVRAEPDLICLEATVFGANLSGQSELWNEIDAHRTHLRWQIKSWLLAFAPLHTLLTQLVGVHAPLVTENANYREGPFPATDARMSEMVSLYRRHAKLYKVRDPHDVEVLADPLRRAAQGQTRIWFIDLTRSPAARPLLPQAFARQFEALMDHYANTYGTGYLRFAGEIDQGHYHDLAHFNEKGRDRYSRWFIGHLPMMLGVNGDR